MIEVRRTIDNDVLLEEVCRMLAHGKKVRLRAKGNSMKPFIYGDSDVLEISPIISLRKGDIVLAKVAGNRYVIHRLVKINDDNIVLMGDGNLLGQEICHQNEVFGIVENCFRNGRKLNLMSVGMRLAGLGWHLSLPIRRFMGWSLKINRK